MANYVNPLQSVASFKNQQLGGALSGIQSSVRPASTGGLGRTAQEAMDAGTPDTSGISSIKNSATRQHNLYLQAIKNQQARTQQQAGGYSGSHGGGGNVGVGRYGLVAGADKALNAMDAAFRKQFGYGLTVNRGYRSYADQARLYKLYKAGKGNLAAKPGTSVHQSGRAVDFGGGLQNASSREHRWMQQNAHLFGFKWTGKNFKQFEPWHWEWWG